MPHRVDFIDHLGRAHQQRGARVGDGLQRRRSSSSVWRHSWQSAGALRRAAKPLRCTASLTTPPPILHPQPLAKTHGGSVKGMAAERPGALQRNQEAPGRALQREGGGQVQAHLAAALAELGAALHLGAVHLELPEAAARDGHPGQERNGVRIGSGVGGGTTEARCAKAARSCITRMAWLSWVQGCTGARARAFRRAATTPHKLASRQLGEAGICTSSRLEGSPGVLPHKVVGVYAAQHQLTPLLRLRLRRSTKERGAGQVRLACLPG